jgi:hypothetical protein
MTMLAGCRAADRGARRKRGELRKKQLLLLSLHMSSFSCSHHPACSHFRGLTFSFYPAILPSLRENTFLSSFLDVLFFFFMPSSPDEIPSPLLD